MPRCCAPTNGACPPPFRRSTTATIPSSSPLRTPATGSPTASIRSRTCSVRPTANARSAPSRKPSDDAGFLGSLPAPLQDVLAQLRIGHPHLARELPPVAEGPECFRAEQALGVVAPSSAYPASSKSVSTRPH